MPSGLSRKEQFDKQWEDKLQLAILFYEQYGRFPKQYEQIQGVDIGGWCARQRQLIKHQVIRPERLEKLQRAGFLGTEEDALRKAQEWEENFQVFQSFVQTYNRFPKQNESHMGVKIGYWYEVQRRNSRNPKYPDEYRQRLISLGMTRRKAKIE